ncbi:MAG: hypothetical protein ACK5KL_06140 [Dysgonomonas sp.]
MKNKIILNVNSFLLDTDLFYLKGKYLYYRETRISINQEGYRINKYKDNIFIEFFSTDDGFEKTLVLSSDKIEKDPAVFNIMQRGNILKDGFTLFLSYDKEYNTYINIINLNLQKVVWSIIDTFKDFRIIDNRHVILIDKKSLMFFNFVENVELWHFSIQDFPPYINDSFREQEADIKQIIGMYNNLLWIYVGGWHLVSIDINSGKEVHHIENVLDLFGLSKEDRYHVNLNDTIHLNEQEGVLKMFAHRYYFEINLNTLQGEVIKDFGPNWNPDWRIKSSNYYQQYPNLLFFCGYYKATDAPNAFGIFDTEKAEIIWYDTTKDDLGYFYNPPQVNDKLLAILDDKHNLLIYERYNEVNI